MINTLVIVTPKPPYECFDYGEDTEMDVCPKCLEPMPGKECELCKAMDEEEKEDIFNTIADAIRPEPIMPVSNPLTNFINNLNESF